MMPIQLHAVNLQDLLTIGVALACVVNTILSLVNLGLLVRLMLRRKK